MTIHRSRGPYKILRSADSSLTEYVQPVTQNENIGGHSMLEKKCFVCRLTVLALFMVGIAPRFPMQRPDCNAGALYVPNTKRAALASIKAVISGFSALNDTRA
ncbi:MAG: hypothetical protein JWQ42_2656 [Edaphobacter sp.]|nr:hypothetical protein [Edaphobacter sp.]